MKNKIALALILLLQLFLTTDLVSQNWHNLDFAEKVPSAAGWNFMRTPASNGPVKLDDGTVALYLAGPFAESNSGAVNQTVPFRVDKMTRYHVSAQVKTKGATSSGASLYVYGKAKGQLQGYIQAGNLTGDNDWQEVSLTFIADDRMDSVRLGYFLEGEGEAWFRGVSWEELPPSNEPIGERARGYLDTFFQMVQEEVIYSESVDWPAMRRDVDALVAGAQGPDDTHDALNYILRRINRHSFLIPPKAAEKWMGTSDGEVSSVPQEVEVAVGHRIDEKIAYLTVPQMGSGHGPTLTYFADTLQSLIEHLDTRKTTSWVIDLRKNGGGNCWPMLAGIGPLLGEGTCGYFMAPDGADPQAWIYKKGNTYQNEYPQTAISRKPYKMKRKQPRVAVLMGPGTASSGEIVAVSFIDRPNTRSFGQPTAGYSTTNQNYYLSDGAIMLLTVSVYADRNKQVIPLKHTPDVVIEPQEGEDVVLNAAVEWLRKQ